MAAFLILECSSTPEGAGTFSPLKRNRHKLVFSPGPFHLPICLSFPKILCCFASGFVVV